MFFNPSNAATGYHSFDWNFIAYIGNYFCKLFTIPVEIFKKYIINIMPTKQYLTTYYFPSNVVLIGQLSM